MRYLLSLALIVTACTKANPEHFGGAEGTDLSTGPIGGGGNGGGGGGGNGGGGGGGGGSGGVHDMSMPGGARDMARVPDMASFEGVACGNMTCPGGDACCINNNGSRCLTPQMGCSNGPLFLCDGPEDCAGAGFAPTCCLQFSNGPGGTRPSGSGCVLPTSCAAELPMCHTVADCPGLSGYTSCCAIPNTPYRHCSKNPCP
jgi:hypothetical protein